LSRNGTIYYLEKLMSFLTRAALMRESGRSLHEVDKLLALGLPHERIGNGRGAEIRIPRGKALAWLTAFVLDARSDLENNPELAREKARLTKEQADAAAMANAKARGELLRAEDVLKADEVIFAALRDRVMHVSSVTPLLCDLAQKGEQAEARAVLRQALRDALEEVGTAELVPAEPGDGDAAPAG
jgi:phage terminase Nu1 subunit (DNA packaging protein)